MRRHLLYGIAAGVLLAHTLDDGRRRNRRSKKAGGSWAVPPAATPTTPSQEGRSLVMKAILMAKAFGTRRRAIVTSVAATAIVCATAATAAWLIFTGISGSAGGKSGSPQTVGALTITADTGILTSGELLSGPSSSGAAGFDITNASGVDEKIVSITAGAVTSDTAGCEAHVTFDQAALQAALVNGTIVAGASNAPLKVQGAWHADATYPASCAGATFTVPLSGTTNP